jgi:hypothetical protein
LSEYQHFLITRFNVKVDGWKTTKNSEEVRTEAWLKNRFYLFERYCLPSVMNQTRQSFLWYIVLDSDTPMVYQEKMLQLIESYANIELIFIDNLKQLNGVLRKTIKQKLETLPVEYIITTRLDNDDLIHKNFIKSIQQKFQPSTRRVVDIREGYQLSIENKKSQIRLYRHPFNAFITLIEHRSDFRTIFSGSHYGWREVKPLSIIEERLWIELVHDQNKVNQRLDRVKKEYDFAYEDFSLEKEMIVLESRYRIFVSNRILSLQLLMIKFLKSNRYMEAFARKIKGYMFV